MNKNVCEFGFYDEYRHVKCKENNSPCLYSRYCDKDHTWWVSDKYSECQRRHDYMRKKNNKKNIFIQNEESNVVEPSVIENVVTKEPKEQWIVDAHGTTTTVLRKGTIKKIVGRLDKEIGEIVEL